MTDNQQEEKRPVSDDLVKGFAQVIEKILPIKGVAQEIERQLRLTPEERELEEEARKAKTEPRED